MEHLILKKYKEGKYSPTISKELGVTKKYVREVLFRNGIISKYNNTGNTKHSKNINFFDKPNIVSSYWAGFIAADGHLSQDNGVIISLAIKDVEHLENFKTDIEYSGDIKVYKQKTTYTDETEYGRISIYSKDLCNGLIKHWKVTHNKTYDIKFPTNLSKDNVFAYCVGYIDGDGSFNKSNGKFHSLNICGHKEFLTDMRKFLCEYLNEDENSMKIYHDHSIFKLSISRKNLLTKMRNKLILKFNEIKYMKRKWNILLEADLSKGRI
jgi:hypothetical protein